MLDQRLSTIPQHHWISKLFGFDFSIEFRPGNSTQWPTPSPDGTAPRGYWLSYQVQHSPSSMNCTWNYKRRKACDSSVTTSPLYAGNHGTLRLSPRTMIAGIAHLIDYVRHKFSLSSQDVHEGWMNRRVRKGNIVVVVVIAIRTISTIPIGSRTQHHPVNKQNG